MMERKCDPFTLCDCRECEQLREENGWRKSIPWPTLLEWIAVVALIIAALCY